MSALSIGLLLIQAALGGATLSGQVVTADGTPLPQAQVFIEPGIGGALQQVQADSEGRFVFSAVNPGAVGLFAVAEGYGFNGQHVNVLIEDHIDPITIALKPAGSLSGKVDNHRKKAVEGARITRAVLLGDQKVAIPLGKLSQQDFPLATTDSKGQFTLNRFATGDTIALKVVHKDYAQTGTAPLTVGTKNVSVRLYPGIIAQGTVTGGVKGVDPAHTIVLIQNAQPPHNTALVKPDAMGSFALRLNPGTYLCRAQSGIARSPGWQRWVISQDISPTPMTLSLSGAGIINGSIKNAVTGEPLAGVPVSLRSAGNLAGRSKTSATGRFRFEAGAGPSIVSVEPMVGYFPPQSPSVSFSLADGQQYELPGMWMKPIPAYTLEVLATDGLTPVSNASIRMLQPQQYGTYATDNAGIAALRISQAPEDNRLIGMAEDATQPLGAVFALSAHSLEPKHPVPLYTYATVTGNILTTKLKPAAGVIVAALMQPGKDAEPVALWRSVTQSDGSFTWNTAVPGIPYTIVAYDGVEAKAFSASFQVTPGEVKELEPIQADGLLPGEPATGKRLDWYKNPVLAGNLPTRSERQANHWLVVYGVAESQIPLPESLAAYQEKLPGLRSVLVLENKLRDITASIPVVKGKPMGTGTCYLVNREGKVIWESFGLPALHEIRVRMQ